MAASALVKGYSPEAGSHLVSHLLAHCPRDRLLCLMLGAAEVAAALVRKRNADLLSPVLAAAALAQVRAEVLDAADLLELPADNALIYDAIPLADKHALNSTDCVVPRSAVVVATQLRLFGNDLVLVASEQRLLRAAQAEGLATFDPETQDQAALLALLGR